MIIAFISSIHGLGEEYDDYGSVRGNGKNVAEVFNLKEDSEEGRIIFTNYFTTFSKKLPAKEIMIEIDKHRDKYTKNGVSVGLTEMETVLNSLGSPQNVVKFCAFFAAQSRKRNCDIYWDAQILWEVNNRWRNQTDEIYRPFKIHADGKICLIDRCKENHWVKIFGVKPYADYNILGDEVINCQEVGKLYKTDEVVFDEIVIEKRKK